VLPHISKKRGMPTASNAAIYNHTFQKRGHIVSVTFTVSCLGTGKAIHFGAYNVAKDS
jgi:hypothetical protein